VASACAPLIANFSSGSVYPRYRSTCTTARRPSCTPT
jgi:hypothetical protein